MGTQHANEVSSNASIGGKFGASYSVFAPEPLRGTHDALGVNSLVLGRMIQKQAVIPAAEVEFARAAAQNSEVFPCQPQSTTINDC